MKKYRLLKDLPFYKKWDILYVDSYVVYNDELLQEQSILQKIIINDLFDFLLWDWFEEIKELKPKFKVWDYVVKDDRVKCKDWLTWKIYYIKINTIRFDEYLKCFLYNGYKEEELRSPTKEELEKYFI